eukprot:m.327822 g.327822  ORF g.327822 m.327822 type:complete len:239 (+) comp55584_c0_seq3:157-873(+)
MEEIALLTKTSSRGDWDRLKSTHIVSHFKTFTRPIDGLPAWVPDCFRLAEVHSGVRIKTPRGRFTVEVTGEGLSACGQPLQLRVCKEDRDRTYDQEDWSEVPETSRGSFWDQCENFLRTYDNYFLFSSYLTPRPDANCRDFARFILKEYGHEYPENQSAHNLLEMGGLLNLVTQHNLTRLLFRAFLATNRLSEQDWRDRWQALRDFQQRDPVGYENSMYNRHPRARVEPRSGRAGSRK